MLRIHKWVQFNNNVLFLVVKQLVDEVCSDSPQLSYVFWRDKIANVVASRFGEEDEDINKLINK
jgi:hypothetical protein